ncbi:tenascin-X [Stigmatella aurantiaca]|nr:tenascin-X [Stigmatella aurantiaca]
MGRRTMQGGTGRALLLMGFLVGLLGVGCRESPPLTGASGRLRLSAESVTFPSTYIGQTREDTVRVLNAGRAPLDVRWTQVDAPFTVEGFPERLSTGEAVGRIRFSPVTPGTYSATLVGTSSEGGTVSLTLAGEARVLPECALPGTCYRATFDVATERCVAVPLEDGTPCDPGNECVLEARCVSAQCKGRERVCDDGNACTSDVCNPLDGCTAVPAPPCPGDGKCQVGVCDPARGCGLVKAPDGTFCGSRRGCDGADVCVDGACALRDLPDGFVCAPGTPCQGEGRCQGPDCARPPATALVPNWTFDAAERSRDLHDIMVWPDGSVTLAGFFSSPMLDATGERPVSASGTGRRCMLWNERLLCMDYPLQGTVSLLDRRTGEPRWTFTLTSARPDLGAQAKTMFMARLAVMAPDRLAALFEAYPATSEEGTLCRVYFLVVLDAKGGLISGQLLEDPLLSECNHPHPFGLVSNTAGDLFVAFSPTVNSGAPLQAGAPTLLLAYSADGVERWRRTLPMPGGELGTVRGLLLPEYGTAALSTVDGTEQGPMEELGRAVATRDVVVPSPAGTTVNPMGGEAAASELKGYTVPGLAPLWTYSLSAGQRFTSKELRLADTLPWGAQGAETLALGFASDGATPTLVGVRTRDGSEAFQCALAYEPLSVQQLFELGPESLVLMDGSNECGQCDPPFAYSRARFQRFPLLGMQPTVAPWPGTFGGPGHGHHELPVRAEP